MSKMLKVVGASWLQTKISSYILGLLGILAILALFIGQMERIQEDGNYAATVFYSKTGYRIEYYGQSNKLEDIPRGVARAYFRGDVDTDGWSLLEVETDGSYADEVQAYAAGIVEGALTWYLIHTHLENTIRAKCLDTDLEKQCNKLKDALDKSIKTWKNHADDRNDDPFWHHVSLHYTQIHGIFTGWQHGVERSLNEFDTDISDLYWLNSVAEVAELQHKLNISLEDPVLDQLPGLSSAFLKIVNETSEDRLVTKRLFVAQNAAGNYSSMTRILKRYKLNYHVTAKEASAPMAGLQVDFSGYPGSITSQDEFYVLRGNAHRMAVTGTTLRNYNNKLWKEVNITEQVPLGPRITAANHLATNVSTWGHLLATNNSGTGSKQWLVVDFNKFDSLHDVTLTTETVKEVVTEISVNNDIRHTVVHRASPGHANGLLWLIEQVPGRTHARDLSNTLLEQGYFATFGLPFIKDISDITLTTAMRELHGNIFSETESPRAMMFKRGATNATTLEAITSLMRQTNKTNVINKDDTECFKVECIIKEGDYWSDLGVRGDIIEHHSQPFGVIDTKVVSGAVNQTSLEFIAIAGPPYTVVPPVNNTTVPLNKGTVATIYTDQFNDKVTINGFEIQDLVQQQIDQAEQHTLDLLNKHVIKPFQWSESNFEGNSHEGLPDKWAFGPYKPKWSW